MSESTEKRPFSDKRWHDNPFEGALVRKGKPLTPEKKKEANETLMRIIRESEALKEKKTGDANG